MSEDCGNCGGMEPHARSLLTLDRYGKILGLDPMHFQQGYSSLRPAGTCNSIWHEYDWQDHDKVSRDQLRQTIAEAERDIADQLGYWPAPTWFCDERHQYPRPQRTDIYRTNGLNARSRWSSVRLTWGYVITGGKRACELLDDGARLGTFQDYDGDDFDETATVNVTVDADIDPCEVHAYYKEYAALDAANCRTDPMSTGPDPRWEIPIFGRSLSGVTLTINIKAWDIFKPQLKEELAPEAIDADTATNYVDEVMFYRIYTDPEEQVTFEWHSDVSCTNEYAAAYSSEAGAFAIRDRRNSIVLPEPGTYDSTEEMFTKATCWAESRDPDWVRFWYYAGYTPERRHCCDDLDPYWAETIAMLATARLALPLCNCSVARNKVARWQADLAEVGADRSWNIDPVVLSNPFGTRRGEVEAWQRLTRGRGRPKGQAILA